jgi:hypothetical protein
MKLPLTLDAMVEHVGRHLKKTKAVAWIVDEPSAADLDHMKAQTDESRFDPHRLRATVYADLVAGKARLVCKRGVVGRSSMKVLAAVYPETEINWSLWGDIFRTFTGTAGRPVAWRVVLFAHPRPREMPVRSEEPGPAHVNGGYAIAGDPASIVIYREEEAPRVLLHEMLHAAGTDDMRNEESKREVLTETWAELFLVAVKAKGSRRLAASLWETQARWIENQESLLRGSHNVLGPHNYAWRYTVGRSEVLAGLGIGLGTGAGASSTAKNNSKSLSFTPESLN